MRAVIGIGILLFAAALQAGPDLSGSIWADVRDGLAVRAQADSAAISVTAPVIPASLREKNGLSYSIVWPDGIPSGSVLVPVELFRSGKKETKIYVTAVVRRYMKTWVTTRLVNWHETLDARDAAIELRDVTDFSSAPIAGDAWIGKRARRALARGRTLTEDMLEELPLVKRGDPVKIMIFQGNMELTLSGEAREDGWRGDLIRVRDPKTHTEVTGRVKSEDVVEARW